MNRKDIKQNYWQDMESWISKDNLILNQDSDCIVITKDGALQLIEILKEFINENSSTD